MPVRPFFAVASVLGIAALPGASFAQTTGQTAPNPPSTGGNTLNLTLETGPAPDATPQASLQTTAPPVRRIFITNVPQPGQPNSFAPQPLPTNRNLTVLSSRSNGYDRDALRQNPNAAPTVSATLGLVLPVEAQLRMGKLSSSRLLNVVHKGMYLAVVADGDTHWGVLMVNNTMGWINKSSLQMIDYHTEVSLPNQNTGRRQLPAFNGGSGSAASMVGSLTEGLEARSASILREAFTYLGVPYVWAGNTRAGLDCSAFVKSVYAAHGVRLPRTAAEQARVGRSVGNSDDLLPGDRLYFDMGRKGRVSHCGIYVGNGLFIHASTNHGRVDVDPLSKPNYSRALVAVRR